MSKLWSVSFYQRNKSLEEKFWEKVGICGEDECWEWRASKNNKGYGNFYVSIGNSKDDHWLAHRMSYKLSYEGFDKSLCVLHKCDNPPCVNPKHLWQGTNYDNVQDKLNKGRMRDMKGENNSGNKLTESKVKEIRELYATGNYTYEDLGKMFDVHYSTIGYVNNGRLWSHVK